MDDTKKTLFETFEVGPMYNNAIAIFFCRRDATVWLRGDGCQATVHKSVHVNCWWCECGDRTWQQADGQWRRTVRSITNHLGCHHQWRIIIVNQTRPLPVPHWRRSSPLCTYRPARAELWPHVSRPPTRLRINDVTAGSPFDFIRR